MFNPKPLCVALLDLVVPFSAQRHHLRSVGPPWVVGQVKSLDVVIVPNTHRCPEAQSDRRTVVIPFLAPDDSLVVRGKEGGNPCQRLPQLVKGARTVLPSTSPDHFCAEHSVMPDLYLDPFGLILDVQNGKMPQVGLGATLGAFEGNQHE